MTPGGNNPKSEIQNLKLLGRREWLRRLGETAVLVGLGGRASEAKPDASPPASSSPDDLALPSGLYEPSNDHLSHALSSDARFYPVPEGSETDYVRPPSSPFQPQFLSEEEFQTVRRIVELILGEAAAPSEAAADHKANGSADPVTRPRARPDPASRHTSAADEVTEWIDLRLSRAATVGQAARQLAPDHRALAAAYYGLGRVQEMEAVDPPKTCRDGLRWVADESERLHQKPFLLLDPGRQREMLEAISDSRPHRSEENGGTRFFRWLKGEAIRGYYTSQAGLNELGYRGNAFYPQPPGCEGRNPSTVTRENGGEEAIHGVQIGTGAEIAGRVE